MKIECPVVTCHGGKVKGFVRNIKENGAKPVFCYRNIPFARPPVGSLRFMPPIKAKPWEGVLDGTVLSKSPMQSSKYKDFAMKYDPFRIQSKIEINEDCLYLSVYTPSVIRGENLPVLVWIYGGGFQLGTELIYDGSALAAMNDVVIVTPNYRLGVFGFFSLGKSSICPGDAGILDMLLALGWVRDNIDAFGGDNGNVTIAGESSGGVAVNFLINSPLSRGLFHKAISSSGTALMPQSVLKNPTEMNEILFKEAVIQGKTDEEILKKLQNLPAEKLQEIYDKLSELLSMEYLPILNGKIVTNDSSKATKAPYIIGVNNSEGHGQLMAQVVPNFIEGMKEIGIMDSMKYFLPDIDASKYLDTWNKFYIENKEDPFRFSKMFGDVIGDAIFVAPAVITACAHAEAGSKVYLYEGAFQLRMFHDENSGPTLAKKAKWCKCDHGDDTLLLFGMPFTPEDVTEGNKFTEEEKELSKKIMTYFTNFAKTGDPNKGAEVEIQWPEYKPYGKHLYFDNEIKIGEKLARERVELWTKTIPELGLS